MAMRCEKCNGIILDVMFDGKDRCACKNHIKEIKHVAIRCI